MVVVGQGGGRRGRPRGRSGSRSSRSRSPLAGDDGGHLGGDEEGEDEQEEEGNWTQDPTPPTSHAFTGVPGMTGPIPTTPLGFFQLFFTYELLHFFMEETNDYASYMIYEMLRPSPYPWYDCTVEDIARYLGIIMWMGIVKMPQMKMYWARHKVYSMPAFGQAMSRTTFEAIGKFFHCFNRRALPKEWTDKLMLIRPVLEYIQVKCQTLYVPQQHLSLDEGMLKWKGRLNIKVYNPKKPVKYGIKFYFLCESKSGYVLDFSIYRGTYSSLRDTVFDLMEQHLDKGYHIFMDNYYNSVNLAQELYNRGTHCSGTLRISRGAPFDLKEVVRRKSLQRGEMTWRKRDNIFVICWQDLRCVNFITTAANAETEPFVHRKRVKRNGRFCFEEVELQRPKMVSDYVAYMGGVDHFDQMVNYYAFARRSARWTKKTTMYLIQMALYNSYTLYVKYRPNMNEKCMTFREYHECIASALFFFDAAEWPDSGSRIPRAADLPEEDRYDRLPRDVQDAEAPPAARRRPRAPFGIDADINPLIEDRLAEEAVDDLPDIAEDAPASHQDAPARPQDAPGTSQDAPGPSRAHAVRPTRRPRRAPTLTAAPMPRARATSRQPSDVDPSDVPVASPPPPQGSRMVSDHPDRLIPSGSIVGGKRIEHRQAIMFPKRKQRRCRVCVKEEGGRGDTMFGCTHCKVALCTVKGDCFIRYHTLTRYWRGEWPKKRRGGGRGRGARGGAAGGVRA